MIFNKRKLLKYAKSASVALIFLFVLGTNFKGNDDIYERINRNMDVFGKVYKEIALNYVDDIDADKFVKAGIEGMLGTLDPYTVFYDQKSKDEIDLITTGKYGGIGITIGLRDSVITITDVMNGYEAQRKGLRIGDRILEVNGVAISGSKTNSINNVVRGLAGTDLTMKINRDNEIITFLLTRQEIILKNVSYSDYIGDVNDGIAYVKLDRFTMNAESEVDNVLKTLKSKGNIKGVVFDLRDNSGGLLDAAIGILNKFVERNSLLLITKGKQKESEKKYFSKDIPVLPLDVPVVVLVNQGTASASEIVAGAIQDLDRGVIVGTRSFGKGLVQQVKDIGADTKLKVTTSRYYTPSGRWIQAKNYFKENKSGVFIDIETYSQTEFKTLGGRIVYANGGISPDVEIKLDPQSEIFSALAQRDLIYKFANYYADNNQSLKSFKSDDSVFEQFKSFIRSKDFKYSSDAGKKLAELRDISAKKNFSAGFNANLDKLETELSSIAESDLDQAKAEINAALEREINKRIITESEQIKNTFASDPQLQEALRIAKDIREYKRLLGKN